MTKNNNKNFDEVALMAKIKPEQRIASARNERRLRAKVKTKSY